MFPCDDDLHRIERAHIRAWPALETASLHGWLWRWSGGGSRRANSVSTLTFTGCDADAAIRDAEARYRAKGQAAIFQTFPFGAPAGLEQRLAARGYQRADETVTMITPAVPNATPVAAGTLAVARSAAATQEWLAVYLGGVTENRREANARLLAAIPAPRVFVACLRDGEVIATALAVLSEGCAVIECVMTKIGARRQGAARMAVADAIAWAATQGADCAGLQVLADNAGAIALYRQLGFAPACENRFWLGPELS
jgi:ribosomal protein S18 acetylase RimI-like enzyme